MELCTDVSKPRDSASKPFEISRIHQRRDGDKAIHGVYQGTRAEHCPYGKRSQPGSLFIM